MDTKCTNLYNKEYIIEKATLKDTDELEVLYDSINDYLSETINYAGWKKGLYPVRENAINGIKEDNLFVLRINDEIAGSIILNNHQEAAYYGVDWGVQAKDEEVMVIHTFVVNPKYLRNGVGEKLLTFAKEYFKEQGCKALRLDVSINNAPAIALYEKCGFRYVTTVDLGLNVPNLIWFKLYEY
ncbi:GNAT family N-acetyltransferase [Clostridium sp. C8-1-8]|uniref:GNAT family N-acetyltransferase n=1 Tax=Clostridium sp. C8-1-8 TaxID=2698831 RepID=UPI00136B1764|nr:GNAT family N-acetyltransferase [Clostridium sp. C8-1-8]